MPQNKKVAVVLSGCGFLDGSEITEAVSTLIALTDMGAEVSCFAPNIEVAEVDHLKGEPTGSKRNVLTESARIARGHVRDLKELKDGAFDALVFPGGFGAAKNLSSWATQGSKTEVLTDISRVVREFHSASKPIGFICIAPTIAAKVLGSEGVNITIGNDAGTAAEIEKTGAHHVKCAVNDYVSDRDHKVLTTPAYMYDAKPSEVFTGIRKMISELIEMA